MIMVSNGCIVEPLIDLLLMVDTSWNMAPRGTRKTFERLD